MLRGGCKQKRDLDVVNSDVSVDVMGGAITREKTVSVRHEGRGREEVGDGPGFDGEAC